MGIFDAGRIIKAHHRMWILASKPPCWVELLEGVFEGKLVSEPEDVPDLEEERVQNLSVSDASSIQTSVPKLG